MSARHSSVWITSMSEIGSTRPATWITLSSSKQRTTFTMASVSRMWARNWLPRPSPWLAPATKPAMSTNSTMAGTMRVGRVLWAHRRRPGRGNSSKTTLRRMFAPSVDAQLGRHPLTHAQLLARPLAHDGIHSERDGAIEPLVLPIGPQGVPHRWVAFGCSGVDVRNGAHPADL